MEHYKFGDRVEKKILSGRLAGCWLPGQVIKINEKQGTVGICIINHIGFKVTENHVRVPLCHVRRPKHKFKVNDSIKTKILRGRNQGLWIPAIIIYINQDGTYDLLVEEHRSYLVTKYAVHVPEKYMIPGDSIILERRLSSRNVSFSFSNSHGECKSPDSKKSKLYFCDSCRNQGYDKEQSRERKSSSPPRSITIDKSYINNLQLFQSHGTQQWSDAHSLDPRRALTGEISFHANDRHSQLIRRPLSVSIPSVHASKRTCKSRYCVNHCHLQPHLQPPGAQPVQPVQLVKPCIFTTTSLSDRSAEYACENNNTQSRESYEELMPPMRQIEPVVTFVNQQKREVGEERSQTRLPPVERHFSDWEHAFEWPHQRSGEESPTCALSPSGTTDWSWLSPKKSGSPTDQSNFCDIFASKRESGRSSGLARFMDRTTSVGGKSTILSSPRSRSDFMASPHKDRIVTIGVKGHNIKYKTIDMDTPLEDIASWLSEGSNGSNVKRGTEKREPRMVRMMSFRRTSILIPSKGGESIDNRPRKCYKLSDLLGKSVDTSKQGLAFFVGPVDGKLSYKISVFDKDNVNNMDRLEANAKGIELPTPTRRIDTLRSSITKALPTLPRALSKWRAW